MHFHKYILAAATLLVLASCEKEIDLEYHDIEQQQVIEGLLTEEGCGVRLTKTVSTDEPFENNAVTDALVTIADLTEPETFLLLPDESGFFSAEGVAGTPGHEYELTVRIGTDTYSSISRMLPPTEIVSAQFNWIKMPYDDVAVLKVELTQLADPRVNYWLKVYRNGEIYDWQALESRNAVDGIVTGMLLTSRKDTEEEDEDSVLKEGDRIDIEVLTISEAMADYLDSLNNGDYNGNRMVSGSFCLGYFLAAPLAKTQIIFHPDQIPYDE